MFYNVRLLSDLSYEGVRSFPVRRSGYDEHLLRLHVRNGCLERQLFLDGTAQRL